MTQPEHISTPRVETKFGDSLKRIRKAAQELHRALSDVTAQQGEDLKTDLHAISQTALAVAQSIKSSLEVQNEASKEHLTEAVSFFEAAEKHVAESLKSSGFELESSIRRALMHARSAAQEVSEAVAAKRSAESTHSSK